jgi:hypothetical protein
MANSFGMARTTDPQTSKDAAVSVTNMRASQARVLAMFKLYGDLTDEQLLTYLHDMERAAGFTKVMSPSGARSRRSELSKPNMDRLDEIMVELVEAGLNSGAYDTYEAAHADPALARAARETLRVEGFRSALWDTGERRKLDTGRMAIVWGIAR